MDSAVLVSIVTGAFGLAGIIATQLIARNKSKKDPQEGEDKYINEMLTKRLSSDIVSLTVLTQEVLQSRKETKDHAEDLHGHIDRVHADVKKLGSRRKGQ